MSIFERMLLSNLNNSCVSLVFVCLGGVGVGGVGVVFVLDLKIGIYLVFVRLALTKLKAYIFDWCCGITFENC